MFPQTKSRNNEVFKPSAMNSKIGHWKLVASKSLRQTHASNATAPSFAPSQMSFDVAKLKKVNQRNR